MSRRQSGFIEITEFFFQKYFLKASIKAKRNFIRKLLILILDLKFSKGQDHLPSAGGRVGDFEISCKHICTRKIGRSLKKGKKSCLYQISEITQPSTPAPQ